VRRFGEKIVFPCYSSGLYWLRHFLAHAVDISKLRLLKELSFAAHLLGFEKKASKFCLFQVSLSFLSIELLDIMLFALFELDVVEVINKNSRFYGWWYSLRQHLNHGYAAEPRMCHNLRYTTTRSQSSVRILNQ
jgi:hypothetical protein